MVTKLRIDEDYQEALAILREHGRENEIGRFEELVNDSVPEEDAVSLGSGDLRAALIALAQPLPGERAESLGHTSLVAQLFAGPSHSHTDTKGE